MNATQLLDELARCAPPPLPGAACRDTREVFDDDDRVAEAIAVCRSCPALEACEAWITGLPAARRPGGVVAGKHRAVPTFRVHAGTSTVAQRISALASRGPISVTTVAEQLGISANRAAVEVRRHKGLRRVSRGVYEATG